MMAAPTSPAESSGTSIIARLCPAVATAGPPRPFIISASSSATSSAPAVHSSSGGSRNIGKIRKLPNRLQMVAAAITSTAQMLP